ncbi:MAG: YggS family pyridoxal phosphate-dependent enzyme [Oscillospiraceae bacterium]|jgi:pyridoxal phosphate enzyme (YggS family)
MSIAENVARIKAELPPGVLLCAAAKQNGAQAVREAIRAGVDCIGENRVQELLNKESQGAYEGAPLHFIGHLQRNKARFIVGRCELIHSVDSHALMSVIDKIASSKSIVQDVLIEVNIGREETKSGVLPEELDEFLEGCFAFSSVRVVGLMAIPPAQGDPRRYFSAMHKLYVDMNAKKYDNKMKFLSMGMSGDYLAAAAEGANIVRVGTAIFGARIY